MSGDVGGSTTGRVTRRERLYRAGHEALENWAAFQRATHVGPSRYQGDPIFRQVRSGYREASALRSDYNEDYALQCDRLFARLFVPSVDDRPSDFQIALAAYVVGRSVRNASRHLRISADNYQQRVDELTARVDAVVTLSRLPLRF